MNHSATIRRLAALENLQKTVSPGRKCRSNEHIAGLLCNYDSLWLSDGGVLLPREERYTENLRRIEEWRTLSLTAKLEKYSGLFNEV